MNTPYRENELKGRTVICAFPAVYKWRVFLKENNVTWTEDDDKCFVEGIVSGDSFEKGISIVAQENSEWCMIKTYPFAINFPEVLEIIGDIRQGYINLWLKTENLQGRLNCPYS
jgi:hypothetical protein